MRAKPLSSPERPNNPPTVSGCVAKYAKAVSTATVNAAKALQDGGWGARVFVFCPREAIGWSSGTEAGSGGAGSRSQGGANTGWGALLG